MERTDLPTVVLSGSFDPFLLCFLSFSKSSAFDSNQEGRGGIPGGGRPPLELLLWDVAYRNIFFDKSILSHQSTKLEGSPHFIEDATEAQRDF